MMKQPKNQKVDAAIGYEIKVQEDHEILPPIKRWPSSSVKNTSDTIFMLIDGDSNSFGYFLKK